MVPAILPVGTSPGKLEYSPRELPTALPGAALPSIGDWCDATSQLDRRRTNCPGQSDRRCKAPNQRGRFDPVGTVPPVPGQPTPAIGMCLHTLRGNIPMVRPDGVPPAVPPGELTPPVRSRRPPQCGYGRAIHKAFRIEAGGFNVRVKIGIGQHWWIR